MSEPRPIKFRGKIGDVWSEVTPDDDAWEQFWALVDKSTVRQFTGMEDKNGWEIFEGDIVRLENACNGAVTFKNGCFYYGVGNGAHMAFNAIATEYVEIIANMYVNSEMLSKGQEA